jgi:hypothetical protein
MSEILNLSKEVYKDDDGAVIVHHLLDRVWLHVDLYEPVNHKILRKGWDVLDALEDNLRSRGIKRYYTCVDTEDRVKFASYYGFRGAGQILNLAGFEFDIMYKEL